jgi:hypothetical protein
METWEDRTLTSKKTAQFARSAIVATQSWLRAVPRSAACAAVILSIVPLVLPIFLPDFLIGHDSGVHQTHAFLTYRALQQGQLAVRWVEGIVDGPGQPLFNYYPSCNPGGCASRRYVASAERPGGPADRFSGRWSC